MSVRHFLKLGDRTKPTHKQLFARTHELKRRRREGKVDKTLDGKTLVLLFEKASTRTRLSFEAGMFQLGGHCIDLPMSQSQLNRGEPLSDTAKVIAGYADAVVFRTHGDDRLAQFAGASSIPVINGLSDGGHPVQLLADLFTVEEKLGGVEGTTIAFVGDGATNMGLSFIEAAHLFGFQLRLAAPVGYQPPKAALHERVHLTTDPREAIAGADVVVTDVWTSMGQEAETAARLKAFAGFQVDAKLLALAKPKAIVLHCLPAHRGEEISGEVIDGPQSVVFQEAENRMHVQKALLEDAILNPTMLSQLSFKSEYPVRAKSAESDLLQHANEWVSTIQTIASKSGDPHVEIFGYDGTYESRTVYASLWQAYWYSAQSGSDWGEYYHRVVEMKTEYCKVKSTRVLGERMFHVTENEDPSTDASADARGVRDAILDGLGMR